ncbi:MAG: indole-3-glycerol phosphate synthase TrpC [Candidatus Saganbacteria bacterium]|nr:indole-3-glycerol phosphate synthase TrpC [Candidatus Saganbacteria bacterium]
MILDDIISNKRQEIASHKVRYTFADMAKASRGLPRPRNFEKALPKGKLSLIAEIKRASPTAGAIRDGLEPTFIAKTYEECGASAISILTDAKFFAGSIDDLKKAKDSTTIPVLRKDFIIDTSQIFESRIAGADAILLIASVLKEGELHDFVRLTHDLGMKCLLEVHDEKDTERALNSEAKIIGINNRDLQTFTVDLETTPRLIASFPELKKIMVVSESGIRSRKDVEMLRSCGVDAILVGETLLRSRDILAKIQELIGLP